MRNVLHNKPLVFGLVVLCAAQALLLLQIHPTRAIGEPIYRALDVGQGDATLVELPGNVSMLTDAGPDRSVVAAVSRALGSRRYIDIGVITHIQKDHFYGFVPLFEQYRFGVILWNGRTDAADKKDWDALLAAVRKARVPMVRVGRGDRIHMNGARIDIFSPGPEYRESAEPNDTGVIEYVRTAAWSALLTADIDTVLEDDLIARYGTALHADILKAPHHGSKYGSSEEFLLAVSPQVVTVSAGVHNVYHHPSPETLERYRTQGIRALRTDQDGTIIITGGADALQVHTLPRLH